jgi:Domain of unknown function (DUF309)
MMDSFVEGIRLFNSEKFFEAHEALEASWLKSQGDEKAFLHGLIQIAAAFHHYQRMNLVGFNSLLAKGREKLLPLGAARDGIDLARLGRELEPWRDWLALGESARLTAAPPLPRIERVAPGGPMR